MAPTTDKTIFNKGLVFLLFTVIGFSLYIFSFDNEFLLDDTTCFSETSSFYQVSWNKIFSTPYIPREGRYYRPITTLLFKLEHILFRENLFTYHLLNLILHITNAYIVFLFVETLFKNNRLSLLTALFFLIHPFSAETVLTLIASSDMTGFMFFLLTLLFWAMDYKILAYTCYTLALFTRETTLVLLPALIYMDSYRLGFKNMLKSSKKHMPLVLITIVFLYIRAHVLMSNKAVDIKHITWNLFPRLITSLGLYTKYLGQFIIPFNICPNLMIPIDINWWSLLALVLLGLCILVYIKGLKAKNTIILFSMGFFILTILPSANITPLYPFLIINRRQYLYHVPRHLYLPSVGIFILISYIYLKYFNRKKVLTCGLIPFLALFSILTVQKVSEYDNAVGFYQGITKRCPSNFWGHCFLAASYRSAEKLKDALKEIKTALKLQPQHHDIHKKMADIYCDMGEYKKAIREYRRSIKLNPFDSETYQNMGITYNNFKQYEKAIQASYRAIKLNPTCSKAYTNIGNVCLQMNKIPEAEKSSQRALELNPNDTEALLDLGTIYMKKEMFLAAIDRFERCLRIDPKLKEVYPNLAECYMKVDKIDKAISALKKYLNYFPDEPATWNNLGICYAKLNQTEQARVCWEKAISYNTDISSIAKDNLQRLRDKQKYEDN